jgi:hypothetical protein
MLIFFCTDVLLAVTFFPSRNGVVGSANSCGCVAPAINTIALRLAAGCREKKMWAVSGFSMGF